MDLLERYLADVRRNLPPAEAEDIVAELRDLLLARAEEQEERTGSVDWNALLQDFGHPITIAARYRKQQWLIGPDLYPFYVHFLKIIVGIVLAVVTGIAVVKALLSGGQPGQLITGYLGSLWWAAASSVGWVTIIFVFIERFGGRSAKQCRHWKPSELPDVLDRRKSVYESVFEVAAGILILLWWVGVIPTPHFPGSEFRLVAAPVWQDLFWPVTALLASQLAFNLMRWLRPRSKLVSGLLGAATACGALVIAAVVYRAGSWMTVVATGMPAEKTAGLQTSLDLACKIAVIAVIVIWSVNIITELWRMTRSFRHRATAAA
ncbi:MAG: HAAS signaling domain-containing protein [Sphingomicrobium sp.]